MDLSNRFYCFSSYGITSSMIFLLCCLYVALGVHAEQTCRRIGKSSKQPKWIGVFGIFCPFLICCFFIPYAYWHMTVCWDCNWWYNNQSFKTLEQVKAALKNGIDNTKSFSKSKVLAETTPNTSGRKANFRSLLFSMLELRFFFYAWSDSCCCHK